ncbi:MAG: hypothetical protein VYC71_10630, partial [Planctomycetota bacterium]|nr:hypothetical protein [Planctomycetota bacterium]
VSGDGRLSRRYCRLIVIPRMGKGNDVRLPRDPVNKACTQWLPDFHVGQLVLASVVKPAS